ncbi:MAG: aspartate aminotransferase family protein [Bryobacteraceae bacterium]
MNTTRSAQLGIESRKFLAGGVSSMLRASAKPLPLFFDSASGSGLMDVDGNGYIDYTLAWGPLILGHSHPELVRAVSDQISRFQLLGAQHELEIRLARKLCDAIPCAEMVALSNTGSEAVQLALRLARAHTGRRKFVKFEGHYHGWSDGVLISYRPALGPGVQYDPQPGSGGQAASALDDVVVLPWNDARAVRELLEHHPTEVAAIILEPILCNSSCLMPASGYLQSLRDLCTRFGVVLIFDEVITGFRVSPGGAQALFGVIPDLATFGKAVAGGFPLSVVGGKAEIMQLIPDRKVVHAGTFNGNPLALAAAEATLDVLTREEGAALGRTRLRGERLIEGIRTLARDAGIPLLVNGVGSAFHLSFTERTQMLSYRDTLDCDIAKRDAFLVAMLENGVYLLSDGRWYVSTAHTDADVEKTLAAVAAAFSTIGKNTN